MKYSTGKETKRKIIETAFQLMADKGFDALSIDEIMKHIGRTKGSFYVHFKSKEEMLYELMRTRLDRGYGHMAAEIKEELSLDNCDVRAILEKVTAKIYASLGDDPLTWTATFYQLVIYSRKDETVREWLELNFNQWSEFLHIIVERGQELGQICSDMDTQTITNLLMGIVLGYEILYMLKPQVDMTEVLKIHDWLFVSKPSAE
ncbi:TetR family transcriptional regulator [Laceyella sediminis]|uniref:TetR family transcriptional regulator n=1 Tax=Laceyella sediminis TaxID=573074 RepID=A0ABX5EQP6_9BACL|nr:TetR/AcrR family transcriptional regulator [Laceyella sediminis]PRZ15320.1 TetR family transcriptional regulator [Laceyella sediminis]